MTAVVDVVGAVGLVLVADAVVDEQVPLLVEDVVEVEAARVGGQVVKSCLSR
jgi:hypothetical protein